MEVKNFIPWDLPDDRYLYPPPPKEPPHKTCFDEDGDLIIRVGPDQHEMQVCSLTLRRSSIVFKKMLFGLWKESIRPEMGPWTVDLPEDHPAALEVLFAIIHGRFNDVPTRGLSDTFFLFARIMSTADKYFMTHVTGPWVTRWKNCASSRSRGMLYLPEEELLISKRMTYVAWEIGDEQMLRQRIMWWACSATIAEDGKLGVSKFFERGFDPENPPVVNGSRVQPLRIGQKLTWRIRYVVDDLVEDGHGPPDLDEIIAEHRREIMQRMLDFFHNEYNSRLESDSPVKGTRLPLQLSPCKFKCKDIKSERIRCNEAIVRGMVNRSRAFMCTLPPTMADNVRFSVANVEDSFLKVFRGLLPLNSFHRDCMPLSRFQELLRQIKHCDLAKVKLGAKNLALLERRKLLLGLD
ncbi:hypothetical protein QBC44DRAFT_371119 [Cladorrhinum sp. PSN332]|nr:hypothetical protein QBC44DRAFT_371119 [Cladorrhinum sp. PSN332]